MNAWAAIVLWGEAVGDRPLRDLWIWLYTTELAAIEDYWFDVEKRLRPEAYTPSVVTMLWGGKGVNETWFSRKPALVHGINWLPFHGGSLYLGRFPSYCRRNYEALVLESGGAKWAEWGDLILMYRALDDPADALRRLDASPGLTIEEGNSRANLYHWIHALAELGQVDRTVTADHPLHAVFAKDGRRSYVTWNAGSAAKPLDVRFSDGTTVQAGAAGPAVVTKEP